MKEQFGVEPKQIEQVMLLAPRPDREIAFDFKVRRGEEPPPMPIPMAGVIRLNEPLANKEALQRAIKGLGWGELTSLERAGKTYFKSSKKTEIAVYTPDERTIVFGSERLLGSMVDKVLFVVKWGSTRPEVARNALNLLRGAGCFDHECSDIPTAIVTQVDLKRHARYRYGDVANVS